MTAQGNGHGECRTLLWRARRKKWVREGGPHPEWPHGAVGLGESGLGWCAAVNYLRMRSLRWARRLSATIVRRSATLALVGIGSIGPLA
jgi:hypothetical protein